MFEERRSKVLLTRSGKAQATMRTLYSLSEVKMTEAGLRIGAPLREVLICFSSILSTNGEAGNTPASVSAPSGSSRTEWLGAHLVVENISAGANFIEKHNPGAELEGWQASAPPSNKIRTVLLILLQETAELPR